MEYERQRDTEALLRLIRGEIGLRKVHKDITLPRVVGYIHELGSYRRTNMKPDEINNLNLKCDHWHREAITSTAKLGEIRIWLAQNDLDMDDILRKVTGN